MLDLGEAMQMADRSEVLPGLEYQLNHDGLEGRDVEASPPAYTIRI